MLLFVFALLILIGLTIRPRLKIAEYLPIAFLCLIKLLAQDAPDFSSYEKVYNWIGTGAEYHDTGVGWYYLCKIGNWFSLDYRYFSTIVFAICLLIINKTIKTFIPNYKYRLFVWTLYLVFPALLDAVQIRFFVAEAIVLLGLPLLIKKKVYGYFVYACLCLFAALFHSSGIFYILFLLGPLLHKIQKYLVGFVILMTVIMIVGKGFIYQIASQYLNGLRIERYLQSVDSVGPFGVVAYTFTLLLFWVIARYFEKKMVEMTDGNTDHKIVDLFYQMSVIIWLVVPLTFFDTNFFRIQRPMWLMLYILCISMINCNQKVVKIGRLPALRTKTLTWLISLYGLVFYICVFNFDVINSFLL